MANAARQPQGRCVRLPVLYLDPAVPEHALILEAYRSVTKRHKTEWMRLRLYAGVLAMADRGRLVAADDSGVGTEHAAEAADTRRGMPPMPHIFAQGT